MKTPFSLLIAPVLALIVCQCVPKPVPASVIASRCLDYLIKHDTAHYQRSALSKSVEDDSTTLIATFSPKPGANLDEAEQLDRWSFTISTKTIVPLDGERYLVKYYGTDDGGNHYPGWDYLLATSKDGQLIIERKRVHAPNIDDDDLDLTIKRATNETIIAQTLNFGPTDSHCCPNAIGYYAMAMRGDSLVKIKQVAASDTL